MRKVLLIAALLALAFTCQAQYVPTTLAAQQHGGTGVITIVQHKSTFCLSATTCALAFSSSVGAGHFLIYAVAASDAIPTITTDNNTNSIVNDLTYCSFCGERIDYVVSSHSGSTTVTGNVATSHNLHVHIWEISGLAGSPDKNGTTNQTAVTALTVSTGTATTTANELVFGLFFNTTQANTFTVGSGYGPSETTNDTSGFDALFTEVKIVSTTGVQTATATAATSSNFDCIVATFK